MKIVKTDNPVVVDYLKDKLIINNGYDRQASVEQLKQLMQNSPETVFVSVIVDKNEVHSFLIAYRISGSDFVWIWQAFAEPDVPNELKVEMFNMLKKWAVLNCGVQKLRCETHRSNRLKAFLHSWGFEKVSEVLECQIKVQT